MGGRDLWGETGRVYWTPAAEGRGKARASFCFPQPGFHGRAKDPSLRVVRVGIVRLSSRALHKTRRSGGWSGEPLVLRALDKLLLSLAAGPSWCPPAQIKHVALEASHT